MCAAKPSLFSRPAWAATSKPTPGSGDKAVFGQQRVYDEILAEEAKKREEREARRKAKAEKAALKEAVSKDKDEGPKAKKRRVSKDHSSLRNSDSDSDSDSNSRSSPAPRTITPEAVTEKRVTRSTPTKAERLVKGLEDPDMPQNSKSKPTVITLDDDDEEDDVNNTAHELNAQATVLSRSVVTNKPSLEEDEDEDPFIREVRRKAREKARQQELERSRTVKSMSPVWAGSTQAPSQERGISIPPTPGSAGVRSTPEVSAPKPPAREPNVAILIKTHIPGTKDLVINRHSDQSLLHVKNYFCGHYKLESSLALQMFFTWRGTRIYNSTTMTSLINILKREQGIPITSDEDPSNGRIQIDAVTSDILAQQQKDKEEAEKAQQAAQQAEDEDDAPAPSPKKKDGIVLILKCKDVEEMTLRVRPNTGVAKIMRAFQTQRDIDRGKTCWLVFDGERLDPASSVQEVGFEHEDEVEVHPRYLAAD